MKVLSVKVQKFKGTEVYKYVSIQVKKYISIKVQRLKGLGGNWSHGVQCITSASVLPVATRNHHVYCVSSIDKCNIYKYSRLGQKRILIRFLFKLQIRNNISQAEHKRFLKVVLEMGYSWNRMVLQGQNRIWDRITQLIKGQELLIINDYI